MQFTQRTDNIMHDFQIWEDRILQFEEDGFVMVKGLFDEEEIELLHRFAKADMNKIERVHAAKDAAGRESKLWLTSDANEDIYNAFVRCPRLAVTMERLMDDEIYLYHYKMMVKEPRVGGAWEWHQDYGYWYNNGCLYPDMASVMIAVDRAHRGNGCLQVIKGSHKLGRIEHGTHGTQTGADPRRVELALQHLDLVCCEMEPGTALFFHANLLHRSDANTSDDPRWTLICCYNTKHNPCEDRPGHPSYRPLEKWPESRIREIGREQLEAVKSL